MPARMSFALPNSAVPTEGPVGIPVGLDFTGGNNANGDFALEQSQSTIGFVQSVWIDNSLNTKSLTLTISGTQQKITVKAGTAGVYPVIAAAGSFSWTGFSNAAGVVVPVIFMNVDRQGFQWQAV